VIVNLINWLKNLAIRPLKMKTPKNAKSQD